MPDRAFKKIRITFIVCIVFAIFTFIINVLYTAKYIQPTENVGLERWGIIITLAAIFASLKLLHPKLSESDRIDSKVATKKYSQKYYVRLLALFAVFVFNMASLHFTGIKNFTFLAFITIFAIFLCAPNKKHFEAETESDNILI